MSALRVAVLNRGDAAMRFLRTAGELRDAEGPRIEVVAVHTDPDRDAPFVRLADDAIPLGPALRRTDGGVLRPAYCDAELVIDRLTAARVDAVWPGWGFLSEDPDFVELVEAAGMTFIGPPAAAMRALGDKVRAKQLAASCGVPLAPWARLDLADPSSWHDRAGEVGYPLMAKAANGGGGRGIRRVDGPDQLERAVRSVQAEAEAAFGAGEVFLERCIESARHVEVQFLVGVDGRAETLGVRDCSIQRRHQKLVEETPSPVLSPIEEELLTSSTARLAEAAGYRGVGTAEFLYTPADRAASFCEVNARLQVEHTITEVVWGVDLVRAQLDVALGRPHQRSAGPRGCAVQARIVAEDAERGFAPSPGRVLVHRPAAGPHVRVDAGVRAGSTIPAEFDSMIAKVIGWGPTRERAMSTLSRALREYEVLVEDGATNRGLLLDLLERDEVRGATATTGWLEQVPDLGARDGGEGATIALAVAAVELARRERTSRVGEFFRAARTGVPQPPRAATRPVEVELGLHGEVHRLAVRHRGGTRWLVGPAGRALDLLVEPLDEHAVVAHLGGRAVRVLLHRGSQGVTVDVEGRLHRVVLSDSGVVRAPGPALVVDLTVGVGDRVEAGQRIGTLEAMKTEAPLVAEAAGVVERVVVPVGTQVAAGEAIVVLGPDTAGATAAGTPAAGSSADHADRGRWPGQEVPECERVLDLVGALLTGHECSEDEVDWAIGRLDALARSAGPHDPSWAGLLERLDTFVRVEALFERNLLLLDDHSAAVSAESAFHDLCRAVGEGAPRAIPELEPLLARALGVPPTGLLDDDAAQDPDGLPLQLWRLYGTRARGAERERLLLAVLRALSTLARAGVVERAQLLGRLDEVERASAGAAGTLTEAAALARSELGADAAALRRLAPDEVDPSSLTALERYRAWQLTVLEAVATDAGRAVVVAAHASDGSDRRTVLAVEFRGATGPLHEMGEAELAPFATLFDAGAALLARRRDEHSRARGEEWWAAAHVALHGVHAGGPEALLALSTRFEPATRGLALQDVTVCCVPGGSVPPEEYSLRRRGHARMEVLPSDPAAATPRRELDRRALTARRLGVVDPWELVDLLRGRVHPGEVPHAALRDGSFVEHDLDEEGRRLVPVDRPPAGHSCSVIVGVVENPLPGRAEWARRVWIAGDPLRSMGSLGEPECRRVIAAIDLAEELGVPLEWVSISSGARIAWDSGTENLDWTAAVLRRIVEFTRAGGEIDVIVAGTNVGAQSYWNAEATMLMHTRGILVMTPNASMVLTGRRALELSGSVGAQDEVAIGGHDRTMGPNGQSQYRADDLADAYAILMEHHALTHAGAGRTRAPVLRTTDPVARDVCLEPYKGGDEGFATIGDLFDPAVNPGRKRPFSIRAVMGALVDRDGPRLERWRTMADADGAVVWETRLGGHPVALIGIESRPRPRRDAAPVDGPAEWAGGTLYPAASKKVARALRAASGNRAAVVLANLSGFDGSPESLRRLQLEHGAEIARAVVEFDGPIVFTVIGRYHGGAYVVFSKRLNPRLTALAVEGSYASVIGGAPAAAVVLTRDVRELAARDPGVARAAARLEGAADGQERLRLLEALDEARAAALSSARAEVARRFDAVHTVERAVEVGSLDAVIPASQLRPAIVAALGG